MQEDPRAFWKLTERRSLVRYTRQNESLGTGNVSCV